MGPPPGRSDYKKPSQWGLKNSPVRQEVMRHQFCSYTVPGCPWSRRVWSHTLRKADHKNGDTAQVGPEMAEYLKIQAYQMSRVWIDDDAITVEMTVILVGATNVGRQLAPCCCAFQNRLTADCTVLDIKNTDLDSDKKHLAETSWQSILPTQGHSLQP